MFVPVVIAKYYLTNMESDMVCVVLSLLAFLRNLTFYGSKMLFILGHSSLTLLMLKELQIYLQDLMFLERVLDLDPFIFENLTKLSLLLFLKNSIKIIVCFFVILLRRFL